MENLKIKIQLIDGEKVLISSTILPSTVKHLREIGMNPFEEVISVMYQEIQKHTEENKKDPIEEE